MPLTVSAPSNIAITLFDQPAGAGHSLSLTGTGRATLADYPLDSANPALGTWHQAVRSYRANNTHGSFRTPAPARRHESFGPNFEVIDAGQHAHNAAEISINWFGWDQWIQSGSIVSWADPGPPPMWDTPVCMDILPERHDDYGFQLVLLIDCASQPPGSESQKWRWDNQTGAITHVQSGKCIDTSGKILSDQGYWYQVLVLKDPTGGWSQRFAWDNWRKMWLWADTGNAISIIGDNHPRQGLMLGAEWQAVGEWDQLWLPYFYSNTGQWWWP